MRFPSDGTYSRWNPGTFININQGAIPCCVWPEKKSQRICLQAPRVRAGVFVALDGQFDEIGEQCMDKGYLSINEAAEYLGVKPSSLYSMVERREIPYHRIGRLIKLTRADLDAFMQESRVDRVDPEKEAKKILNHARNLNIDVDALVRAICVVIAPNKHGGFVMWRKVFTPGGSNVYGLIACTGR